jgi:hypothetical protein
VVTAAKREIGRRVHPKTGRTMIYVACTPASSTLDMLVGDEDELSEVKWASADEANELLSGMYEPVRNHIRRELAKQAPSD